MSNNLMRSKLGHRSKPTTTKGLTPVVLGKPHRVTIKKGHLASKKK